jgi:hypothetical protein
MDANGYTAGILYLLFARSVWKQGIQSLITHTDSTYPCDLSRRGATRVLTLDAADMALHKSGMPRSKE